MTKPASPATPEEHKVSNFLRQIIENDLDVLPTVLIQFSFNFYEHDIKVEVELFDSRPYGGYHAIQGLSMMINFSLSLLWV